MDGVGGVKPGGPFEPGCLIRFSGSVFLGGLSSQSQCIPTNQSCALIMSVSPHTGQAWHVWLQVSHLYVCAPHDTHTSCTSAQTPHVCGALSKLWKPCTFVCTAACTCVHEKVVGTVGIHNSVEQFSVVFPFHCITTFKVFFQVFSRHQNGAVCT